MDFEDRIPIKPATNQLLCPRNSLLVARRFHKLEAAPFVLKTHDVHTGDFIEDDFSREPGGGPPCYRHPARGRPIYL
jgi:hypothetical protein